MNQTLILISIYCQTQRKICFHVIRNINKTLMRAKEKVANMIASSSPSSSSNSALRMCALCSDLGFPPALKLGFDFRVRVWKSWGTLHSKGSTEEPEVLLCSAFSGWLLSTVLWILASIILSELDCVNHIQMQCRNNWAHVLVCVLHEVVVLMVCSDA